jgi:hypothetical protein
MRLDSCVVTFLGSLLATSMAASGGSSPQSSIVLRPARVFDGVVPNAREGWVVVVRGPTIEVAGPASDVKVPKGARPEQRYCRA